MIDGIVIYILNRKYDYKKDARSKFYIMESLRWRHLWQQERQPDVNQSVVADVSHSFLKSRTAVKEFSRS